MYLIVILIENEKYIL